MALLFQYMLRGALVATAFAVFVQFAAGYALLQASAGGKRSHESTRVSKYESK